MAAPFRQLLRLRFSKKSKIKGDIDLRLDLENRTTSDRKELTQLAIRETTLAFSDVAGHGYSRSPELGGKTKHFLARESCGTPVDLQDERHCALPSFKVFISSAHHNNPPSAG